MNVIFRHKFEEIISIENLLLAWGEFVRGKRAKRDVQKFSRNLFDNILQLQGELANKIYKHGGYQAFNISDPKPRNIHKASVRDRLVHHAIYRILYPFFDKRFISDSFSCRVGKGTHKALNRFRSMFYKVSQNNTRTAWVLKLDIKRFFASVDHEVLIRILSQSTQDREVLWLLEEVIESFPVGLPLGNLTSQLFCNIYMNEMDQFIKHKLKVKYYIRYADDFVILSEDQKYLMALVPIIQNFLKQKLRLILHPDKIILKTFASGVDFLGWVHFPHHRVLRRATKKRMFRRTETNPTNETMQSYFGILKHGNTYKLQNRMLF